MAAVSVCVCKTIADCNGIAGESEVVDGEVVGCVSRLAMDVGNGRERENRGGRDLDRIITGGRALVKA